MAQLTVRNVPEEVAKALRIRAARHGRSTEAEVRLILSHALGQPDEDDFWKRADALRRETNPQKTDSGDLQRKMRDERSLSTRASRLNPPISFGKRCSRGTLELGLPLITADKRLARAVRKPPKPHVEVLLLGEMPA